MGIGRNISCQEIILIIYVSSSFSSVQENKYISFKIFSNISNIYQKIKTNRADIKLKCNRATCEKVITASFTCFHKSLNVKFHIPHRETTCFSLSNFSFRVPYIHCLICSLKQQSLGKDYGPTFMCMNVYKYSILDAEYLCYLLLLSLGPLPITWATCSLRQSNLSSASIVFFPYLFEDC